jgi:hypothetical protein
MVETPRASFRLMNGKRLLLFRVFPFIRLFDPKYTPKTPTSLSGLIVASQQPSGLKLNGCLIGKKQK